MDNNDVNAYTRFNDIDDLLNAVQYVLSIDRVSSGSPKDYSLLGNYYIRYTVTNEVAVLSHMAALTETLVTRHDLVANPATDPVRARLQLDGWQSVQQCINGCKEIMRITANMQSPPYSAINTLNSVVYAADVQRAQKVPVTFDNVVRLCDLYNTLAEFALKPSVLDMEIHINGNSQELR
jgi:hypothetical protein